MSGFCSVVTGTFHSSHGIHTIPKDGGDTEVYDGHWKDGKMHGLGNTK